jgi:hypothetical protein
MKRVRCLAVWLAVLAAALAPAWLRAEPKLYVLLAGDTQEPKLGRAIQNSLSYAGDAFWAHVPERQLVVRTVPHDDVTPRGILAAIGRYQPGSDDAFVFFWIGHGAHDPQGHFLDMPGRGRLHRREIVAAMQARQPRLVVVVTDSCNVFLPGGPPLAAFKVISPQRVSPLFDELFFKSRGLVNVNSSTEGQVSRINQGGGFFAQALAYPPFPKAQQIGVLWRLAKSPMGWTSLFQEVDRGVETLYRGASIDVAGKQKIRVWDLPASATGSTKPPGPKPSGPKPPDRPDRGSRFGVVATDNGGDGVRVVELYRGYPGTRVVEIGTGTQMSLEPGDVILSVNGQAIRSLDDYWNFVKGSARTMELVVRDSRHPHPQRHFRVELRY